jgi:hypothetical protein
VKDVFHGEEDFAALSSRKSERGFVLAAKAVANLTALSSQITSKNVADYICVIRRFCMSRGLNSVKNSKGSHVAQHCFHLSRAGRRDLFL